MRENEVEKRFVEAVQPKRPPVGRLLKAVLPARVMNGVPDRLVLLLGGKWCVCGTERKNTPGKQMRILQRKRRQQLEAVGRTGTFCVRPMNRSSLL